jgi:zinc protease
MVPVGPPHIFTHPNLLAMHHILARLLTILAILLGLPLARAGAAPPCDYAIVVSKRTHEDPDWKKVVDALVKKHADKYHAQVIEYGTDVDESLAPLRRLFPRYAAFVAQPEEAGREFVVKVHRLTRKLDDDPYTDVLWGIVTGFSAADALRIAETGQPLEIHCAAAGTGINLEMFEQGFWFNEGSDDEYTEKHKGGKAETKHGYADAAKPMIDMFAEYGPQLFLTSGHATWRDWQIGYPPHQRGQFRCQDGVLYGVDRSGKRYPLRSPNPKVYLPAGNCLMGLIRDKQSMALAWLGSGGADQMIGYVVSTWYGRGGWGTRDYFFSEPGRYTLSEAFYFNNQAIVYDLQTRFPKTADVDFNQWNIETDPYIMGRLAAQLGYTKDEPDLKDNLGLHWDRDTVAFYGDPAWEARLAPSPATRSTGRPGYRARFTQNLSVSGNRYTFTLKADADCSPGRPPAMLLPHRVRDIKIVKGQEFKPLVTNKFIMVMSAGKLEKGKTCEVVFTAKEADRSAAAASLPSMSSPR